MTADALVLTGLRAAPGAVAVVEGSRLVTAGHLLAQIEAWTQFLAARGTGPGTNVVVALRRSCAHIAIAVAVMRAGAGYVPLDPGQPVSRLTAVITRVGPDLLVTDDPRLGALGPPVIGSGAIEADHGYGPGRTAPISPHGGDDVAYVMHTSGTSGQPKGVVMPHRALVNRLRWGQATYPLTRGDRVLWHAATGFDFSIWEMLAPLAFGASVVVAGPDAQDPQTLMDQVRDDHITTLHFVPRILEEVSTLTTVQAAASLRYVFSGGAPLGAEVRDAWLRRFPWTALYNQYGPTETCIDSTAFRCTPGSRGPDVPIGSPIWGTRVHLVDESLRPVPAGATGELLIGGIGLAHGYLGAADLTRERFPEIRWPGEPAPARMYRSGDLARRDADGLLVHAGRIDRQIQINGTRVELGDIEGALLLHPQLAQAHVEGVSQGRHTVGTIAYVCGQGLSPAAVRRHAAQHLPATAVPHRVVIMPGPLPRTHKGEVDVQALRAGNRA
ncbi:amino acid adenylation domain-containing protein [Kineosporia sp. NBRC 101731]|uniref:amino acid adenylation domain-containing protein n=1 Tax=Kineosporia sp. NBRC 101731 TaxID=3032199 RepID=UPI0024A21F60|nr:amino acid adenylation domain-containing protein [Kineosporia sp. NBRC 101731]GLY30844.1 hypothetical protein Kisp02_42090 [Kineosporia sp. NBRC 101731]